MGRWDELIRVVGASAPEPQFIRAYHGSPHNFDAFDSRFMSRGDGQAAYGPGLYFAADEAVAKNYRDTLASGGTLPAHLADAEQRAWKALLNEQSRRGAWWAENGFDAPYPNQADYQAAADAWGRSKGGAHSAPQGRMYEVEIGHPESALMDFDLPLGRQSDAVRSVISDSDLRRLTEFDANGPIGPILAGQGGRDLASRLLDAGVPGARYLDQRSRYGRTATPTRNYVMFPGTEDQIRILRKY